MPRTAKLRVKGGKNIDYYEIAVRQFQQQILPAPMPATTVWSYGAVGAPATFNYPAFTIEAKRGAPVRVKWINELVVDPVDCFYTPAGHSTRTRATTCPTFSRSIRPCTGPTRRSLHGGHGARDWNRLPGDGPEPYIGPVRWSSTSTAPRPMSG